ncbi:unnamed protein product, partial [Staurois parvus]
MLSALCGSSPRRWRLITYKSAVCSCPLHSCPVCCTAASSCLVSHCSPGYR